MGGFVIDTDDPDLPAYIPGSPRLSVTAQGVCMLAEHGHLPDISTDFIKDKSKADNVGKSLAILQALWMLVQCMARAAAHLPLTFLELNTLAHVICALLMYLLWMDKPYDVRDPVVLKGEWVRPMCATLYMFSQISTAKKKEGRNTFREHAEIERLLQIDTEDLSRLEAVQKPDSPHVSAEVFDFSNMAYNPQIEPTGVSSNNSVIEIDRLLPQSDSERTIAEANTIALRVFDRGFQGITHLREPRINADIRLGAAEILCEVGLGPKPSSVHFEKRNVSRTKRARWFKPRVEVTVNTTTLTRWRLALSVLNNTQPYGAGIGLATKS